MQVEWLRNFVQTIHAKSLSKAGEKLNLSQTALSKQMKNLEDSFGVSLFHRSATGMELTPEGQLLYAKVQRWLSDIEETKRQLINLATTKHIVIGSLPSLVSYYLPEKIMQLTADGVHVDIVVLHTSEEILDAFHSGRVDVAILDGITSTPKIYAATNLFTEPYYAVFHESHRLCNVSSLQMSDIAHEPFILYPSKCDVRRSLERAAAQHDATVSIAGEVPFGEAILGFVAAGAGITVVPEMIAKHLGNASLVASPIVDFGVARTIRLVTKSTEQFQFLRPYFGKGSRKKV